jgi:hypothetical protein
MTSCCVSSERGASCATASVTEGDIAAELFVLEHAPADAVRDEHVSRFLDRLHQLPQNSRVARRARDWLSEHANR